MQIVNRPSRALVLKEKKNNTSNGGEILHDLARSIMTEPVYPLRIRVKIPEQLCLRFFEIISQLKLRYEHCN